MFKTVNVPRPSYLALEGEKCAIIATRNLHLRFESCAATDESQERGGREAYRLTALSQPPVLDSDVQPSYTVPRSQVGSQVDRHGLSHVLVGD